MRIIQEVARSDQRFINPLVADSGLARIIAFNPKGNLLAAASDDKGVEIWEVANMQLLGHFTGHRGYVKSIAFSSDGKVLATGSEDKTIRFWNVDVGSWEEVVFRMANRQFRPNEANQLK